MSEKLWKLVAEQLDEHSYMSGVERTVDRVKATGEIFTPSQLVLEMLKYCGIEVLAPGRTVLDPACGDGQFLVAAKWVKIIHHGMSEKDALLDIFGIDIMRDNVDLCERRLGGGTILMGNALKPLERLDGQHEWEYLMMTELFDEPVVSTRKKPRLKRLESAAKTRGRSTGIVQDLENPRLFD